jgi:hypothetical protein
MKKCDIVESLQSHCIHTLFQWSTHLLPIMRDPWSIPRGGGTYVKTGILLLALSCYIGDPHMIDHSGLTVWGGLRPEESLGRRADNVMIPLDLTQHFCPGFTLAAGPPSGFPSNKVGCWGGALWRACNLTAFIHSSTGPPISLPVMRDPGSILRGCLCETGILLLALSSYNINKSDCFREKLLNKV